MNKDKLKKIGKKLLNVLEIDIPAILFLILFVCFLLGIVFRYILKDPRSWTFELSTICYLAVGVLSWGIAHRTDDNVVFDMLYNKLRPKTQCILRIITNVLIAVTAALLIMPSIEYIKSMEGLSAQTMPIPRGVIFVPFTVSFVMATIRSVCRLVLDVLALKNGDYAQKYGKKEDAQ